VVAALEAVLAEPDPQEREDECIEAVQLRPGMVLARDLLSAKGAAAGGRLCVRGSGDPPDPRVRGSEGVRLTLHVRRVPGMRPA
jgi:hypothetical protein